MDVGAILDLVILGALILLGLLARAGIQQAGKDTASEVVARIRWPAELAREIERVRGTERQELRFTSYADLWARMRPLAFYDDSPIDQESLTRLSDSLSDWYFSTTGGLMLTSHNRELFFALQDLVRAVARVSDWETERAEDPEKRFEDLLERRDLKGAYALLSHIREATTLQDWPHDDISKLADGWREDIRLLADGWAELDGPDRFAVLQQVSSVLRTGLANDVESRLR